MKLIYPALRSILFALALVSLLAGCGKSSEQTPSAPRSTTSHPLASPAILTCEPGQPGGRLSLACVGLPQTLNPALARDSTADAISHLLFSGLVSVDMTTEEPRPALAESWTVAPDGRTWTFKLRAGLRWSDGNPLTADDVIFTWNEVMYNVNLNTVMYELLQLDGKKVEVTKVDDVTVRMVTPTVFAPFLVFYGSMPIVPRHAMGREVAERRFLQVYTMASRPEKIVGSGPFRLKEIQAGKSILLERNPEFWASDKTGRRLPYFDEVQIEFTSRGGPQLMFLQGRYDICEQTRPEDFFPFQGALPSGKFQIIDLGPGSERDFLWFNLNTNLNLTRVPPAKAKWFREKNFRQAVSCAIDRDFLSREVYHGRATPTVTFLSSENPRWNNTNVVQFGYDPARAKQLLSAIGIQDRNGDGVLEDADGHAIEFTVLCNDGNPLRTNAVSVLVAQLNRLGFKVTTQTVPYEKLISKINSTFDYECVLMGLGGGGLDPTAQSLVLKSSEPLHQWFPNQTAPATEWEARIDALMDAQTRSLDFAERKKSYDEIQAILAEQMPMIYTVTPTHFAVARPNIANLRPSIISPYRLTWNIEELYFKK